MLVHDKQKVLALIPQKPPFVMVDALRAASDQEAETVFFIDPRNILCEQNLFSEAGLIENIAQSAALHMGYLCQQKNIPPPKGFIGDVKDLKIYALPTAGSHISTRIYVEDLIFGVTLLLGEIFQNGKQLASCRMKVFTLNDNNTPAGI
ncbi:MAG: hypothetical protein KatS3mg031_0289 [Chitinophagales bacterium]|nr:MAG: hypothetical protein KatS3mg031_0289 [Chitinophagales bacterium]